MSNLSREDYNSPQYKAFRFAVFKRDGFKCQKCGREKVKLEAHHIKRWADEPQLRYLVSNGITLCESCHDIVTGREEEFEEEFQKIVGFRKNNAKVFKEEDKKKPWKRRNFYIRY